MESLGTIGKVFEVLLKKDIKKSKNCLFFG